MCDMWLLFLIEYVYFIDMTKVVVKSMHLKSKVKIKFDYVLKIYYF